MQQRHNKKIKLKIVLFMKVPLSKGTFKKIQTSKCKQESTLNATSLTPAPRTSTSLSKPLFFRQGYKSYYGVNYINVHVVM